MKIAIPKDSKQELGGGFTFRRNLIKGLEGKAEIVEIEDADVVLITSSSMITPETFEKIESLNKKIVLRVDNVPRNSRNRNTGTSRLKRYAQAAHELVYQSQWAVDYLSPFLGKKGEVIYNGVDTSIFNPNGEKYDFGKKVYLYARFNRDETKRWEEAWYKFQMIHRADRESKLVIVGSFSDELLAYNFDFFNGEKVEYLGIITDPNEMAKIYRGCDKLIATYYNDAYSNTYCEAMACGVSMFEPNISGGTLELIENNSKEVRNIQQMADDYLQLFEKVYAN